MTLKKALLWDENRNQIKHRTGFVQVFCQNKESMQNFASFSSEQEHFTHGMYITALIRTSNVKKSNQSCSMKEWCKVFRRSIAFTIALFVTSRSSPFEYTMSVHAVHEGAERNVWNIVVSSQTPQTTTNPSQTLLPVYILAHLPLSHSKSSPPRPHNL